MVLGSENAILTLRLKSVLAIPGVRTCPKPGHALHVSTFTSANESVLTLILSGIINFLFIIFSPVLFNINSLGLIPIRVSLSAGEAKICLTPEFAENT